MDLHQGNKATDDGLDFPVLTYADVVKQSFHRFAQQPNNNGGSSIQVTDKFDTNLQDINDDCLLEIFSLKFLDPMDLCSLAETCPRFKQITQRVFPKFFLFLVDEDFLDRTYYRLEGEGYNLRVKDSDKCKEMAFRVFENFGSCLSEVAIKTEYYESLSQNVLSLVATYCSDNLKSLELMNIYIPEELKVQLKPIFKQLQKIDIYKNHGIRNADDKDLFADCDSLIELSVCSEDPVLENTYPKLERFRFYHGSYSFFSSFFSRHKSLKTVRIDECGYETSGKYRDHILQIIGRHCQELEELAIPLCVDCDLTVLQNLGQLKKLEILPSYLMSYDPIPIKYIHQMKCLKSLETLELHEEIEGSPIPSALAELKKLRELYLGQCYDLRFTNQCASLPRLKKLRIRSEADIDGILNIIRLCDNLEELQLDWVRDGLKMENFSEIVNLVKRRSKVLILKCDVKFSYDTKNCDENQKVKFVPLHRRKLY